MTLSLVMTPKPHSMKENKWDFIQIKNFYSEKHTVKRMKRQAKEWEKIFPKHMSDKELLSKVCKELLNLKNENKQPN